MFGLAKAVGGAARASTPDPKTHHARTAVTVDGKGILICQLDEAQKNQFDDIVHGHVRCLSARVLTGDMESHVRARRGLGTDCAPSKRSRRFGAADFILAAAGP